MSSSYLTGRANKNQQKIGFDMKNMTFPLRPIAAALLSVLVLQGCATQNQKGEKLSLKDSFKETFSSEDPCANNARNIGIVAGAILGGIIGNKVADNKAMGTLLGLGLGGALGAFIGTEVDKRQCEISKIGQKYNLDMQVTPLAVSTAAYPTDTSTHNTSATVANNSQKVGLSVTVTDVEGKPQFNSGSDELQEDAKQHFNEIAKQYSAQEQSALIGNGKSEKEKKSIFDELSKKRILLIGHTDDIGNSKANAELSEKRAKSVAKLFKSMGVGENQLYYQGAGETMPIDDNATPEGRAKNRRVEIVDLTNDEAFKLYLQNRRAKTEYYRPVIADNKVDNGLRPTEITSAEKTNKTAARVSKKVKLASKDANEKSTAADVANSKVSAIKGNSKGWIDFGGTPATRENTVLDIGEVVKTQPKLSLISEAQANDIRQISSCHHDRPRETGLVKSLKDGKEYATNEHLPGLNGRSWQDTLNGNLVVLNRVAVLRDGAIPANLPELKVYANYNPAKNRNPKPEVVLTPAVNTYQGSNGLIYRVFVQGNQGLQCMDVLMPLDNSGASKSGKIVYGNKGSELVADFKPKMIR